MSDVILLDTGPLGLVAHPHASPENDECNRWLRSQLIKGKRVLVPGLSDYELRRELLRIGSKKGIAKLDALKRSLGFFLDGNPIAPKCAGAVGETWWMKGNLD